MKKNNNNTNNYKSLHDAFREIDTTTSDVDSRKSGTNLFIQNASPYAPILLLIIVASLIGLFILTVYSDLKILFTDEDGQISFSFSSFELNRNSVNIQEIISENASFEKIKEQISEEQTIPFEVELTQNATLPKDEEIISQEGELGNELVSLVKTYENGNLIEEIILDRTVLVEPVTQIMEVGTSEFLATHNSHIGDTFYLTEDTELLSSPDPDSSSSLSISKYLDVTLVDLVSEEICLISFDSIEGYVPTASLTSESKTPSIVETSRIQRIQLTFNNNMPLNQTSGLTKDDFKKVLSGLSDDTFGLVEDNAELFYELEQTYSINGIALASIFIVDTSYGQNLNSLLDNGYSFDGWIEPTHPNTVEDEEEVSYTHNITASNLSNYLDVLCKILVLEYVYPLGVNVFGSEYSTGIFYVGSSIHSLGSNYNSISSWSTQVYEVMSTLYGNL